MTARRITVFSILFCLVLSVLLWYFGTTKPPYPHVDAGKVIAAVHSYTKALREEGIPLPSSVSLEELVTAGFLKQEDIAGFKGIEVTVDFNPESSGVLMRAKQPDGTVDAVLTDGSVQQIKDQ